MQTTDLTMKQLLAMKPYENDNEKLKKIHADLLQNTHFTDGREQDSTVAYALRLFEVVILFNHNIRTFTHAHMSKLAYPFNSARPALTTLIRTTTDKAIMSIDLEKIKITNDKAKFAAQAISNLITLHNTPEPFKDQRLTDKINAIATKIIQYRSGVRARSEPIMAVENDSETLSESVEHASRISGELDWANAVLSETQSAEENDVVDVQVDHTDRSFLPSAECNYHAFDSTEKQIENIPHVPRAPLKRRSQPSQTAPYPQPVGKTPQGLLEYIAEILQCIFYVLDVLITAAIWMAAGGFFGQKPMNDTHNPLAKVLTCRSRFFVRPSTRLTTEINEFDTLLVPS